MIDVLVHFIELSAVLALPQKTFAKAGLRRARYIHKQDSFPMKSRS